jgi:hypothetical protein
MQKRRYGLRVQAVCSQNFHSALNVQGKLFSHQPEIRGGQFFDLLALTAQRN